MKKISILIPCYNEEENVVPMSKAVVNELTTKLPQYDFELIFIDNDSHDNTRPLLREICKKNPRIKAIFNAKNFGQFNSPYYGMLQTTGDCTITMCCDFQDPVEMIPKMVAAWENGAKIVSCIKTQSKENPVMRFSAPSTIKSSGRCLPWTRLNTSPASDFTTRALLKCYAI